jgi:hypothetical protein
MRHFLGYCLITLTLASCLDETRVDPATPSTFVRYINAGNADEPKALEKTHDGGYIILANTRWPIGDFLIDRIKLVKVDQYGSVLWTRILPANPDDNGTPDEPKDDIVGYKANGITVESNGYIISGELINGTETDLLIIKTNAEGHEANEGVPPPPAPIALPNLEENSPDNVQVSGRATYALEEGKRYLVLGSISGTTENMVLAELDYSLGNPAVPWDWSYGRGTSTIINKMFLDGGFLYFGGTITDETTGNNANVRLVRALQNEQGTTFDLNYGSFDSNEQANGICKTPNGYALIGSTNAGGTDKNILFNRIDKTGGLLTSKVFPVTYPNGEPVVGLDEEGNSLCTTSDNGYIVLATINSSTSDQGTVGRGEKDYYLIKANGFGDIEWAKAFGSKRNDIGVSVLQAADGGYVILGQTSLANVPTITLIKTNKDGAIN